MDVDLNKILQLLIFTCSQRAFCPSFSTYTFSRPMIYNMNVMYEFCFA